MDNLSAETRAYIESILGTKTEVETTNGLNLPFFITDAYGISELTLQFGPLPALSILLLLPVDNTYPGAVALKKHIQHVLKATDAVVVYVSKSLSAQERRSLINQQINFIQPGYQMFVPELALDLREHFRKRRTDAEPSALLPASQAMLLHCLYRGWQSHTLFNANQIMGPYKYSRVTLGKVIHQLLALDIIRPAQIKGFISHYEFSGSQAKVFEKARPYLRSPVKRKLPLKTKLPLGDGVYLAGETALARNTMLAEPALPVYGMTKKIFDSLELTMADGIDEQRAWVEIWSYASLKKEHNLADEASLLLSLEDCPDERVQIALDELKGSVTWLLED
ncbi:hypothetical protein [Pseudomonas sp. AMR01]|uniref:hypothetical protein n=1 Tax=Pseudomonas sp. AMR01 TaxID=3064904 RepID=UPI0035C15219